MSTEDDEALARALQEEFATQFRREQQQRASRQQRNSQSQNNNSNSHGNSRQRVSSSSRRQSPPSAPPRTALQRNSQSQNSSSNNNSSDANSRQRALSSSRQPPPSAPPHSSNLRQSQEESDAEFARRLQEQMRQEEASQQRRSGSRSRSADAVPRDPPAHLAPPPTTTTPQPPPSGQSLSDEELARRLEKQMREEDLAWRSARGGSERFRDEMTPSTSRTSSVVSSSEGLTDEELALRVEQEMRDEEVARRINAREQEQVSAAQAHQVAAQSRRQANRCSLARMCWYLIPVAVLAGGVTAMILWLGGPSNIPDIFIPTPEDFFKEDPFTSINASDASRWRNQGHGLSLPIWNALDDGWQEFFYRAVDDWDEGVPDALTLETVRVPYEKVCLPVDGVMKVCNGDYGNTRWRGLNEVLISRPDGHIVASAAKMNEFYFTGNDKASQQYTMCHEVGHGFGLPHTDENFYNKDLGNCMDYTNNPAVNQQPDETNYQFLADLYGVVPGTGSDPSPIEGVDNGVTSGSSASSLIGGGDRRAQKAPRELPGWLFNAWQEALPRLEQIRDEGDGEDEDKERGGWRLLHRSLYGEAHECDLGGGYFLQVHKLLPVAPQ